MLTVKQKDLAWFQVCSADAPELQRAVEASAAARIAAGKYTAADEHYIAQLDLSLVPAGSALTISPLRLELLRKLAALWDFDFHPVAVTSHRPVVGKLIVALKRMLLPMLKALLKEPMRRQRQFNAALMELLTDIASEQHRASEQQRTPEQQRSCSASVPDQSCGLPKK